MGSKIPASVALFNGWYSIWDNKTIAGMSVGYVGSAICGRNSVV